MIDSQVIAFTLIAAVLAVTPGADTMLVMKNSIRSGSSAGWATTFGILGGTVVHAVISAIGISAIVAQSEILFQIIKALGALYLVWLGFQTLRTASRQHTKESIGKNNANRGALLEGLLTNVLNPKVAIFYVAFLPQFISADDPVLAKSLLLASIHNALSLLWLGFLVLVISSGKKWVQKQQVQEWLSKISGVILIGLGIRLALESR
ncbi:MAG: LysE family translocator [Pseudomonadales bacterium]|nr:LysE family translocator [Pseudomonadales bacterium]MCP5344323.1 LysE family translocator [Pseudomonadales bacterium]